MGPNGSKTHSYSHAPSLSPKQQLLPTRLPLDVKTDDPLTSSDDGNPLLPLALLLTDPLALLELTELEETLLLLLEPELLLELLEILELLELLELELLELELELELLELELLELELELELELLLELELELLLELLEGSSSQHLQGLPIFLFYFLFNINKNHHYYANILI